ncbi:MAG: LysE family transporter [Thermomicrobiales bacterium]
MAELLWLGIAVGVGQALAVGPVFLTIVQQSTARGVGAGGRVVVGTTVCDALLLLPALLFAGMFAEFGGIAPWLGALGALGFAYLGLAAGRDAQRLWRGGGPRAGAAIGPFWQGLVSSLANPLAWTIWLAAVAPALMHARWVGGTLGLIVFVAAWFAAAVAVQLVVAFAAARGAGLIGVRGQACVSAIAALLFFVLACQLVARVLPHFFAA